MTSRTRPWARVTLLSLRKQSTVSQVRRKFTLFASVSLTYTLKNIGEPVALKIIDKSRLNRENVEQLGLEIRLLQILSDHEHPNIMKLYQVIDTKAKLFLVTGM